MFSLCFQNIKYTKKVADFDKGTCWCAESRHIALLLSEGIKSHTDILGTGYIKVNDSEGWKIQVAREIKAAGYDVDLNRAF